jgi:parallel beta-helix repeat protein
LRVKRASLIFSFLLLVISVPIFSQNQFSSIDSEYEPISNVYEQSFMPHSPIVITNESDFTDLGFLGNGSLSAPYIIQDLEISTSGDCISISNIRANFTIKDCFLTSGAFESGNGILLDNSTSGTIENCTITNKDIGVNLDHADLPSVSTCDISRCRIGVAALLLLNCSVTDTQVYDCSRYGISLAYARYSKVLRNEVQRNYYAGIVLSSSDDSVVTYNTVSDHLYGSSNYVFISFGGISLDWCDRCEVANNTLLNNDVAGIYLYDLFETVIENNSLSGGPRGVWADESYNCSMLDNTMTNHSISDIYMDESANCTISSNRMARGLLFKGVEWSHWNHTLQNNEANGKQLLFLKGLMNTVLDCSAAGQLVIFNSTSIAAENMDISGVCTGVQIAHSTNVSVQWLTIDDCSDDGIFVESSDNVTLADVTLASCAIDGIHITGCENVSLVRCSISTCMNDGIEFETSANLDFSNVSIIDSMRTGLRLTSAYGGLLSTDNQFVNGSIFFDPDSLMNMSGVFINSSVNGKEVLFLDGTADNVIDGGMYGQVFLRNCTRVSLQHGEFYGIQLALCNGCLVEEFQSIGAEIGISISRSWNSTISNAEVYGHNLSGIYLADSERTSIISCNSNGNGWHGIEIERSNRSIVNSNHIQTNSRGIFLDDSCDSYLFNNTIRDCFIGIMLFESYNITLVNETVFASTWHGIRIYRTDLANVSDSSVYENNWGIEVFQSENATIINNQVLANIESGIYLNQGARYCEVYSNTIGCNGHEAYDYGVDNSWDNGINTGNGWCDYNGSGTYLVSGSALSIDNHPRTISPFLNSTVNAEYELGETGNNVIWRSLCHRYFEISRNGSVVMNSTWEGVLIETSLNGLDIGTWNYTVRVNGSDGSWLVDTVFITIRDTTFPTIDSPSDVQYETGALGHSITWNPQDAGPQSYDLFRNNSLLHSDNWDGSDIVVNIDGLAIGYYNYTLVVYDSSGNSVSDQVMVTVTPETPITTTTTTTTTITTTSTTVTTTTTSTTQTTTEPPPFPSDQIMMVLIMGGLAVIVVIALILHRKRR